MAALQHRGAGNRPEGAQGAALQEQKAQVFFTTNLRQRAIAANVPVHSSELRAASVWCLEDSHG